MQLTAHEKWLLTFDKARSAGTASQASAERESCFRSGMQFGTAVHNGRNWLDFWQPSLRHPSAYTPEDSTRRLSASSSNSTTTISSTSSVKACAVETSRSTTFHCADTLVLPPKAERDIRLDQKRFGDREPGIIKSGSLIGSVTRQTGFPSIVDPIQCVSQQLDRAPPFVTASKEGGEVNALVAGHQHLASTLRVHVHKAT